MSKKQDSRIDLTYPQHISNLYLNHIDGKEIETETETETETELIKTVENVKAQATKVTQAAKAVDKMMEEMISGVLTTREMVRLITNSTKK